jgi:phospholipid transport system substrate-binding protein
METIKQVSTCGFAVCTSPFIELFLLLLLFLVPTALQGAQSSPDAVLKTATADVVATLKQDQQIADDPARLGDLIESRVLPVFDFSLMTQLAMGRNWRQTSSVQQDRLTTEFRAMMVRTYSGMLATYRDHAITYKPIRYVPGDTDATVRSEVSKQGAKSLRVDYQLTRMAGGGWKVYDVKLDGVSVVTAYREGFAAKIRDSGVDGLIRALAEKNRQGVLVTRTSLAGS